MGAAETVVVGVPGIPIVVLSVVPCERERIGVREVCTRLWLEEVLAEAEIR